MSTDTPRAAEPPLAHPLAVELAARLAASPGRRALLLGYGSGRNVAPFRAAALAVTVVEPNADRAAAAASAHAGDPGVAVLAATDALPPDIRFDGALSTHALLHGTPRDVAHTVCALRKHLAGGAPLYVTLASTSDPRFGTGHRIDARTFAMETGSEVGVPHAFFDEAEARALFAGFVIESLVETPAAESAGGWAHTANEAASLVHWFARCVATNDAVSSGERSGR